MSALKTAYASAPVNAVVLQTIEFHHQAFTDENGINRPFRFVSSSDSLTPVNCPLEKSAPVDGGKTVNFDPAPLAITDPTINDNGYADLQITLGDITMDVEEQLDRAVSSPGELKTYYRLYLLDVDTGKVTGPENVPFQWSLQGARCQDGQITATATIVDIVNRPFPYYLYTPAFAPGLVR
ncbi:DUF1833 domain-containing protein [Endozoicomonas sp. Mp262]|uniref:DUF1833 domain-containing protein n=1 Tax=Endozoicomonas sp. Mp262 TaxID=2919499 RepID=UPI0021D875E6